MGNPPKPIGEHPPLPKKLQPLRAKPAATKTAAKAGSKPRPAGADAPFWERKSLSEMTRAEWESLCDGCGKCCLHKFEYEDTGEVEYTNVACRYLDLKKCNCTQYKRRHELVKDCIALTSKMVGDLGWLPGTCAYRRLDEGKNLPPWHPLITGDPQSVHKAGVAVGGKIVSEDDVDDPEDHVVDWIR
jgi:uncharacterized cysteine cluster protein YcgN (CxxCxxCC family)